MKKNKYLIALIAVILFIVVTIGAVLIPKIMDSSKQAAIKDETNKFVGQWFFDCFDGNGGEWLTFRDNGVFEMYEEVTAADGQKLSQSSTAFASTTWAVPAPGKLKLSVASLAGSIEEVYDYQFTDNDTFTMNGNVYVRQK